MKILFKKNLKKLLQISQRNGIKGLNVGEFQIKPLQKVVELTLYVIQQQKEIEV